MAKVKPRFTKRLNTLGRKAFVVTNNGDLWTLREKTGKAHVFTDADQLVEVADRLLTTSQEREQLHDLISATPVNP